MIYFMRKYKENSVKNFGYLFFIIFFAIFAYQLFYEKNLNYILIFISFFFLVSAIFYFQILIIFYEVWIKFGLFLGKFISPIVMAIIFFLIITPIGIIIKVFKKDVLNLKFNKNLLSYWITKEENKTNMDKQF